MLPQVGQIEGDELIKTTSVVEFLSLPGPLRPLCDATAPGAVTADASPRPAFERALSRTLAELEADWRAWLLGERVFSIVERLGGDIPGPWDPPPDARDTLAHLNRRRKEALVPETGPDEELCRGALRHARYLQAHRDQRSRWPVSAPDAPTNPELAPPDAWCLIPKRHLRPATKYTVTAEIRDGSVRHTWSFTTGRGP